MSFTDHKITQFQHKIADLPDEPQIPADELKSRFDACPEELRVAHNAVCDDAARLEARVEGIVVDTFGDTIDKEMLSDELAAELDAKATQTALSAEAAARESADDALESSISSMQTSLAAKCEVYFGTYTGNGAATRDIDIGFTPQAVLLAEDSGAMRMEYTSYGGIALPDLPCIHDGELVLSIIENGFRVYFTKITSSRYICTNDSNTKFYYVAFK